MLKIATQNGAISQGRHDTGIIKEGYRADFAVLRLDRPHMTPIHDVISDIVYSAQSADVEMTVVDGEIVYKDGVCMGFDIYEAMEKASKAAHRIAAELNQ